MEKAVVSSALTMIGGLLVDEVKLLHGVKDAVIVLQRKLKESKALLSDAGRKQQKDELVRTWMVEIREQSYKAEDAMASYLVQRIPSHTLATEIEKIMSTITDVNAKMQAYGIGAITGAESSDARNDNDNDNQTRRTFDDVPMGECFVGRDGDLKELNSLLDVEKNKKPVISVWGMAGLGKTTLVREAYHRMIAADEFDAFAWVCITQKCHIQSVLEDVLNQLTEGAVEGVSDFTSLIKKLVLVQKEKRCLIVLDDLWDSTHWKKLKNAFYVANLKSKILVTTRNKEVIPESEHSELMVLGLLNDKDAVELLKKKAFPDGQIPDEFSDKDFKIGKEMVKKCGHLPLAICLLGGVLREKQSSTSLDEFYKNIDGYSREAGNELDAVLKLSYDDLPYHLKLCFLYLGVLREDESMRVGVLYRLWIAQGMISEQRGKSLMDVAESYLSELAARSIVQVEYDHGSPKKEFKTCKLHDAVREHCQSTGEAEDYRIQILQYETGSFDDFLKEALSGKITRHLVICCKKVPEGNLTKRDDNRKGLRSLHIHNYIKGEKKIFPREVDLQEFVSLKSVFFEGFIFKKRTPYQKAKCSKLMGITDLVLLRLLCFRSCEIENGLPSAIEKLFFLETLDLFESHNIRIPNDFAKMHPLLKHLLLPTYDDSKLKGKKEKLKLAAGLESVIKFNSSVHEFTTDKMTKLQRFTAQIYDKESFSTILTTIDKEGNKLVNCFVRVKEGCPITSTNQLMKAFSCRNLHNLEITVHLGGLITQCGDHITSSNLVCLVLSNCEINKDPMGILGKLPFLSELIFGPGSFVGEEMVCSESSFPKLRLLKILGLPTLKEWRLEQGAVPLLFELHIRSCPALKVPNALGRISTLRKVVLTGMHKDWVTELASEDMRHIRSCIVPA